MNLQGKINLLKLEKTGLMTVNGRSGAKLCVVIPVEENDIYVSRDESLKPKGAYLSINAWQSNSESGVDQYGNSHSVKQGFSREFRERMDEEEMRAKPFIGNLRPWERKEQPITAPTAQASADEYDDLPF